MIIPQAVMGARETQSLRNHVLNLNAEVKFQVFDSVPDFLFDQGKIESNTNTNINQRTVIVSVSKKENQRKFSHQNSCDGEGEKSVMSCSITLI